MHDEGCPTLQDHMQEHICSLKTLQRDILIIAIFNSRVSDKQAAYKNRDSYGRFLADSKQSIFLKFVFKYIAVFKKNIYFFHFALV